MATNIQISDTGRTNVVSRGYLHSSNINFINAVDTTNQFSNFYIDNKYYTKIENQLKDIKNRLEAKEKEFYKIFGINGDDSATNAHTFNKLLEKSLKRYEVLKKMNSNNFLTVFENNSKNTIQKVVIAFEDLLLEYNSNNKNKIDINKILNPTDINSYLENAFNAINVIYPLEMGTSKRTLLKKVYLKSGDINPEINARFSKVFTHRFEKKIKDTSEISAREFFNNMIIYLNPDEEFKGILKRSFDKIKNKLNLSVSDIRQQLGVVGEIQAQVFIDLLLDQVSNETPKSFYIGNLTDKSTGKKSPTDFLINNYGIQVKNTQKAIEDYEINKFFDIHLQRDISLDTFIDRLQSANRDEFKYLIMNAVWLRNNGLNGGERENLKLEDIPQILEYINNILAVNAEMLLHTEASKIVNKQGKTIRNTYGNTFFLIKGKYLIPVSVMIDGLIEALRESNQAESSGIGYFSRIDLGVQGKGKTKNARNISISVINSENSLDIYNTKIDLLKSMAIDGSLNPSAYDYSGSLLDYGASLGNNFSKQVSIRVNYKLITKNLNEMKNLIINY